MTSMTCLRTPSPAATVFGVIARLEKGPAFPVISAIRRSAGTCFRSYNVHDVHRPRQTSDLHGSGSVAVSQPRAARQARGGGDQADGDPARPVACLFARRRGAGA